MPIGQNRPRPRRFPRRRGCTGPGGASITASSGHWMDAAEGEGEQGPAGYRPDAALGKGAAYRRRFPPWAAAGASTKKGKKGASIATTPSDCGRRCFIGQCREIRCGVRMRIGRANSEVGGVLDSGASGDFTAQRGGPSRNGCGARFCQRFDCRACPQLRIASLWIAPSCIGLMCELGNTGENPTAAAQWAALARFSLPGPRGAFGAPRCNGDGGRCCSRR